MTSEERTDTIITGLLRENFEQNSTSSDKDLADILVDLGKKKKLVECIDGEFNVSDVSVAFLKVVPPEAD